VKEVEREEKVIFEGSEGRSGAEKRKKGSKSGIKREGTSKEVFKLCHVRL